ncbi:MAG TPA: aldo/keto reductase [Puia sp.]|jgi:aryl-alcohol dehydrogenase-like predicted oxidoreductase|nr:aldo/keto reductase [Puia sp.]
MEYRKLGNTEVKLSAITFGAWAIGGWMWGGAVKKDALEAIAASYDYGVTSFDTAPIYGQGRSEEIVGEALRGLPRDKVQILTKFGMRWDENKGSLAFKSADNTGNPIDIYKYAGKKSVIKECEDSLHRLGTDYIDLYQIHWPDLTTPISETMEALTQLIKEGKIRAAGVCNYSAMQMAEAEEFIRLASNQVPYSMVERSIEEELVPYCYNNNKSIIAYSPLQRGLLTGKIRPDHKFAPGDHRPTTLFFKPENIQRINIFLERLKPLAKQKGALLSQIVIRWTIEQPGITIALVGARNKEQALQNAKAAYINLSKNEIEMIDSELKQLELVEDKIHV